jgi:hypothetical protein
MPLPDQLFSQFPVPDLDDRRFDELVAELQARLARHVPEMAPLSPGDPVHALVDLFAWLTETVIYRANQIPDRQRLAFLNLLQIPLRPARPAGGIVSIDATGRALPPLIATESLLKAGTTSFSTVGEVQPTPLALRIVVKRTLDEAALAAEGISLAQLRAQYGVEPAAFRPVTLVPGHDALTAAGTRDGAFHLAVCLAKPAFVAQAELVRRELAGIVLNVGLAPLTELEGLLATGLRPRKLDWELAWWPAPDTAPDKVQYLPLEVVSDSSSGGRKTGVARLRLPRNADMLAARLLRRRAEPGARLRGRERRGCDGPRHRARHRARRWHRPSRPALQAVALERRCGKCRGRCRASEAVPALDPGRALCGRGAGRHRLRRRCRRRRRALRRRYPRQAPAGERPHPCSFLSPWRGK